MNANQLEKLIREVTVQVVREMAAKGLLPSTEEERARTSPVDAGTTASFRGRVLSQETLDEAVGDKIDRLVVSPRTLITPLVRDLLRDRKIDLLIESEESSSSRDGRNGAGVPRVLLFCRRAVVNSEKRIMEILHSAGYCVKTWSDRSDCHSDELASVLASARRVAEGDFARGIAVVEEVFPLWQQLCRIRGLYPVIGWDAAAVSADGRTAGSNFLLLSRRSLGLSMLGRTVEAWLAAAPGSEERA